MSLAPPASVSLAIQVHVGAATLAVVLSAVQFLRPRGDAPHRALGWLWAGAMGTAAGSSFFVHEIRSVIGLLSPIHLLSIYPLVALPRAVWFARQRLVRKHRRAMLRLFWLGLVVPGALTLVPGRIMNKVIFAGSSGSSQVVVTSENETLRR